MSTDVQMRQWGQLTSTQLVLELDITIASEPSMVLITLRLFALKAPKIAVA